MWLRRYHVILCVCSSGNHDEKEKPKAHTCEASLFFSLSLCAFFSPSGYSTRVMCSRVSRVRQANSHIVHTSNIFTSESSRKKTFDFP